MWPNQPAAPPAASASTTNNPTLELGTLAGGADVAGAESRRLAPPRPLAAFGGSTFAGFGSLSTSLSLSRSSSLSLSRSLSLDSSWSAIRGRNLREIGTERNQYLSNCGKTGLRLAGVDDGQAQEPKEPVQSGAGAISRQRHRRAGGVRAQALSAR